MGSRGEKDRAKQIQERCQSILVQLLKDEDNKYCVDCDAKGPRWASWNLGIFLCIRCAGIHRNLGVHISKVKSVNLDSWTPEQVVSLQQMGNSRARAVYEANLPDSFRRPQNDSALEAFVRAKYEQRKYIAKEWVQPPPPKVNWDKEIDEEMERQKKKKKSSLAPLPSASTSDKKYAKSDVIPQLLPKPKSSVSPKLGRSPGPQADARPSNGQTDLLGLDTAKPEAKPAAAQDDIFTNFFSGPPEKPAEKEVDPAADLKTEEQNFFNQAAPTDKEKSKLTKDSILALYSKTPSNLNQFGAVPPGGYSQLGGQFQQPQTGFASFGAVQNGTTHGQFSHSAPQNQFNQNAPQNQFNQTAPQNQFNQTAPQNQFNQTAPQNQFNQTAPQNQFNQTAPQNQFNQPASQNLFSQAAPQNFNQTVPQSQFSGSSPNQFNASPAQSNQFSQFSQFSQAAPQFQSFGQFATPPFPQGAFAQNGSSQQPAQPLAQQFGGMSLGQHAFANAFAAPPNANVAGNVTWQ